jgi:hypothetical protein
MKLKIFILIIISLLFFSCEEDGSGYGTFALVFNNSRNTREVVTIYLDGEIKSTTFFIQPQQSHSSSIACEDRAYAASLDNILFLTYVSAGKHQIKIEDYATKRVLWEHDFAIQSDDCGAQPYQLVP